MNHHPPFSFSNLLFSPALISSRAALLLALHVAMAPKRTSKGTSKAKAPSSSKIIDIAAEAAAAAAPPSKRSISAD